MSKHFMIVGADFKNKGGQSMLFNMVNFLKKNFPGCEILVPMTNMDGCEQYNFEIFYYDYDTQKIALSGRPAIKPLVKSIIKKAIKNHQVDIFALKRNIKKTDWLIDISGFNLSSEWNMATNEKYLRYIELAEKYNISVALMPQSFGPFDYPNGDLDNILARIKKCLNYCSLVIAREKSGYDLIEGLGVKNVKLTPDLVLQGNEIDTKLIYKKVPVQKKIEVKNNSVAILPNMKSFEHGNKTEIISLYVEIVHKLTSLGKNVYLMRHASEDIEACKWIYQEIKDQDNVVFLQEELNAFEYEEAVKQFDFIISSRYHGVVHAYKNGIPAVVLGWSEKYNELVKHFNQSKYQFSITNELNISKILEAIEIMNHSYHNESEVISLALNKLRVEYNCFDMLLEAIRRENKYDCDQS